MKILLAFCLVICIVCVYSEDAPTNTEKGKSPNKNVIDCAAQNKVDLKSLEGVDKIHGFPNTPEVQCFLACMMKKEGMMNDDGTLTNKFPEVESLKVCRNLGGKDTCEVAFKTIDCLLKNEQIEVLRKYH